MSGNLKLFSCQFKQTNSNNFLIFKNTISMEVLKVAFSSEVSKMAHFKLNWIRPVNKENLRINVPFRKNAYKIIRIIINPSAVSELYMIFIEILISSEFLAKIFDWVSLNNFYPIRPTLSFYLSAHTIIYTAFLKVFLSIF